ncbi:hypothetical protein VTL71DRAFT_13351 [Oculimacula yallundae]|uniref:Uncharacterized protein n=1 Tax=Oculimacula yallundae TaxID=86028 RepID=A0ABR4CK43_9HELO
MAAITRNFEPSATSKYPDKVTAKSPIECFVSPYRVAVEDTISLPYQTSPGSETAQNFTQEDSDLRILMTEMLRHFDITYHSVRIETLYLKQKTSRGSGYSDIILISYVDEDRSRC